MVKIPKYDKIPPVVRYHGDIEEAKRHRGEALHVLNRLRTQKSFQNLSQDVLRRKLDDGVKVVTRYVMDTPYVDIYAPVIKEKIEEKEKELKACFIQLLTYTVIPKPFPLIPEIISEGFCMSANKDCDVCLSKWQRKLENKEGGYVQNLSQCKYCYKENEGEDNEIVRKASLFHYDNIWPIGGLDRIVRVINYEGAADFEFIVKIYIPPGGVVVDLVGALSEDLTKLYISLYSASGYKPPKERLLEYFIYNLVEIDGERKWELSGSGKTPIGMEYIDNVITRDGKCGCWKDETEVLEEYIYGDTLVQTECYSGGGSSFMSGKRIQEFYKTFSMDNGEFADTEKMKAFHLSPDLKDFAVCKAFESFSFDDGGTPIGLSDWKCVCNCNKCSPTSGFISTADSNSISEIQTGGWSAKYDLFSGIETIAIDWGRFWSGYYHHFTRIWGFSQNCHPTPGHGIAQGSTYRYNGSGSQSLGHGYTTYVYRNVSTNEKEERYEGNCGWDGTALGWMSWGNTCNIYSTWMCQPGNETSRICTDVVNEPGAYADVKEKRLLSPLTMTLQDGESIGNTFISYDEETDSLIRGVRYKALNDKWYWYIKAKIPIRDDEEPFSVIEDCEDKKIDQELKLLLSDEHYSKLEAIIFIEDIKEK